MTKAPWSVSHVPSKDDRAALGAAGGRTTAGGGAGTGTSGGPLRSHESSAAQRTATACLIGSPAGSRRGSRSSRLRRAERFGAVLRGRLRDPAQGELRG